jgi:hypothetical protein
MKSEVHLAMGNACAPAPPGVGLVRHMARGEGSGHPDTLGVRPWGAPMNSPVPFAMGNACCHSPPKRVVGRQRSLHMAG